MLNIPNIYVMGDIHGSPNPIFNFYHKREHLIHEGDVMILLGDSGINYYLNGRDDKFKKKLSQYPFTYFVIRGNHDERPSNLLSQYPDLWHYEDFFHAPVMVENKYPNIKYAMDTPEIYHIPNHQDGLYSTLVIPGAYSVDKYYRLMKGWTWFEDEQLTPEEMDDGMEILKGLDYKCDLILSHTCPCMYEPTDLFFSSIDQSTVDKSMERYLNLIEYSTDYKAWLWGHFHEYRDYPRPDGRRRTMLFQHAIELNQYMTEEVPQVYE